MTRAGRLVVVRNQVIRWAREVRTLLQDAASSLVQRPWHAVGMVSGIMLGVASATAAIVVADTQQAQIDLRFDLQRADHAVIQAETPSPAGFLSPQVSVVQELDSVVAIGEFSSWSDAERVTRSTTAQVMSAPVLVADPSGLRASETSVVRGASGNLLSAPNVESLVWVGEDLAEELNVAPLTEDSDSVGDDHQVVLAGRPFTVAGVVTNDSGFDYVKNAVVISRRAALNAFEGTGSNIRLVAHVRPGAAGAVADYAIATVDPGGTLSLVDQTPADGDQLLGSVATDLRRVGTALGLLVGLIGMVAVSNTLMMAVHNRMRELGLRSAIGWSRRRVAALVLTESGIAGTAAGLLGAAVGLGAAATWCAVQDWTLVIRTPLPATVIVAGVVASLVGGLIPALRASSVSPLTAMRS